MILNQTALVGIGLLLAAWMLAAAWMMFSARARGSKAEAVQRSARRMARMVDESPALPLLVRTDGRIEAPQRLAQWLGLDRVPQYLTELDGGGTAGAGGIASEQLAELTEAVRRTPSEALRGGPRHSAALRGPRARAERAMREAAHGALVRGWRAAPAPSPRPSTRRPDAAFGRSSRFA